ncbi:MAG: hypothetical protein L6R40_005645 [Gallowayella cf. fulva]|nr:MAG: hypothetical protein L6R40_005645 [Xanthomendoza cf. fulva]
MSREAPFSSITAGPASATAAASGTNDDDNSDDSSGPTATTRATSTLTLRRTVLSSPRSSTLTMGIPPAATEAATGAATPPSTEPAEHSHLGAGIGGGLGGALAALLLGIAIVICWRRRRQRSALQKGDESKSNYHEMDTPDPAHRHNSRLFPAELNYEDSKTSLGLAELGVKTAGPYELLGDTEAITVKGLRGGGLDRGDVEGDGILEDSGDVETMEKKIDGTKEPESEHATDSSDGKDTGAKSRRPLARNRPDSTHSQSGPWHDSF